MALSPSGESSRSVFDAIKGALGIFENINKANGVTENLNPTPVDEYESDYSEREIIDLTSDWKRVYSVYYADIEPSQKLAFEYWIGKQRNDETTSRFDPASMIDNQIFSALETFLPIANRANPDPLVQADPSEIGQKMAHDIKVALVNWADTHKLRRKLARLTRHWAIYKLGVLKLSWNPLTKDIEIDIINPKRMIFDKNGHVAEDGRFIGEYEGEKKRATASHLSRLFPKKAEEIKQKAQDKMGTMLEYFEWWYHGTDVFYTIDDIVLGKYKNPNWNYDGEEKIIDPETQEETVVQIQGSNHFPEPRNPYLHLSIFSTGLQPHDETSLITQNVSVQDVVNRRWRQIDDNVRSMNNGMVVSGTSFTEEQASQAAAALRRGVAIRVPNGNVNDAVVRLPAVGLPNDVFNSLKDARQELSNSWGTAGSTAEGTKQQDTVRGKILVSQMDSTRIGGGVTEQIEQVADSIYNMVVQFMYVYYDEEHFIISTSGTSGPTLIALKNDAFPLLKSLNITVKEGSLIPKDPLTQRNEAIDLWSANAIDPRTLFNKLDYPDPNEATKQLILWQMVQKGVLPPQAYIPDFALPQQPLPQTGVGGQPVNPIDASQQQFSPKQATPEAVGQESRQLLQSVPIQ